MGAEIWFTEKQTEQLGITLKISQVLHQEQTAYQHLAMVETEQYGTMMLLDNCVMTTDKDEFVYHEMMAHIPLFSHPNPKRVLIVGGGDGGVVRECLKHKSVEEVVLAEIDDRVIWASKEFMPQIAAGLTDPRCKIMVGDGIAHVKEKKDYYDVIIVDSTDPIGPAVGLFAKEFYQAVHGALKEDGLFVAQSESPFLHAGLIRDVQHAVGSIFKHTRLYLSHIPTYPSGMWSHTIGSKKYDPQHAEPADRFQGMETKYYTPGIHVGAFMLPRFVADLVAPANKGGEA